jgi:hypothetical protein
MSKAQLKLGKMENAPYWYGTPLEKLHFEWTKDEELMIERFCEKILKNCAEEEMTPMQRWDATWNKKPKDRLFIDVLHMPNYAIRTLDSWADAIKPGDTYKYPKLGVLSHLATTARFKLDIINWYMWAYTEELWGGNAKMGDYATPMVVGAPPIKTLEDLAGVAVPDPKKHGLFPGYLWAARETINIMKKYGLDKKIPIVLSFCGDPLGTMHLGMTGFGPGMVMAKKDQALFKACMEKAAEWCIKLGNADKDLNPTALYVCSYMGAIPPLMKTGGKEIDNSWIADNMAMVGKAVQAHNGKYMPMYHLVGAAGFELWQSVYLERGAVGDKGGFGGWWQGPEMDPALFYGFARENDLWCGCSIDDHALLNGDMATIENLLTVRAKEAKRYAKHSLAFGTIEYWTPQPVLEKSLEMAKKLGKF